MKYENVSEADAKASEMDDEWEKTTTDIEDLEFDQISTGLKITIEENCHSIDMFHKLFGLEMVDLLVIAISE